MVVLPAPVWPTNATVSPGSMVNDTSRSTQSYSSVARSPLPRCDLQLLALAGGLFGGLRQGAIGEPHVVELDAARAIGHLAAAAGETISAGVSSSLKMRSLEAMADCRMLYFSLKSWIGRKKRCAYCMNATSTPSVTSIADHLVAAEPDTQAIAIADSTSTTG